MKKRKIRIVCDGCPLHQTNCYTCLYNMGVEGSHTVYCDYSKAEEKRKQKLYRDVMGSEK